MREEHGSMRVRRQNSEICNAMSQEDVFCSKKGILGIMLMYDNLTYIFLRCLCPFGAGFLGIKVQEIRNVPLAHQGITQALPL